MGTSRSASILRLESKLFFLSSEVRSAVGSELLIKVLILSYYFVDRSLYLILLHGPSPSSLSVAVGPVDVDLARSP